MSEQFAYNGYYDSLTAEQYSNMNAKEVHMFQMYLILREYHEKMEGTLTAERKVSSILRYLDNKED